ncbi:MAG TPA: hypothetical protein VL947_07870, partial [Cytophagales bacterium]|nr:hypothetical protein [Cytophagales bacterium]
MLLLTITGNGWSQSIPWTVKVTGANHTLFISEAVAPSYAGMPLDMGDAIGVFYDSAGTLTCAGILEWTGVDTYITAYGSFAGAHGFK